MNSIMQVTYKWKQVKIILDVALCFKFERFIRFLNHWTSRCLCYFRFIFFCISWNSTQYNYSVSILWKEAACSFFLFSFPLSRVCVCVNVLNVKRWEKKEDWLWLLRNWIFFVSMKCATKSCEQFRVNL